MLYGANVNAMTVLLDFFEDQQWVVILLLCALAGAYAFLMNWRPHTAMNTAV